MLLADFSGPSSKNRRSFGSSEMPRGKTFTPVILLEVLLKGAGKLSFKKAFLRLMRLQ